MPYTAAAPCGACREVLALVAQPFEPQWLRSITSTVAPITRKNWPIVEKEKKVRRTPLANPAAGRSLKRTAPDKGRSGWGGEEGGRGGGGGGKRGGGGGGRRTMRGTPAPNSRHEPQRRVGLDDDADDDENDADDEDEDGDDDDDADADDDDGIMTNMMMVSMVMTVALIIMMLRMSMMILMITMMMTTATESVTVPSARSPSMCPTDPRRSAGGRERQGEQL
eukprot:3325970-Pyramimonas_sp.AAC.1